MMNDDKQKLTQDRPATCQIKVPGHLWYALSIQAFPVAIAIVLALGLLLGASTIINFTMPTFATAMIPLAVIFFVFAFFALLGGVLSQQRRGQSETQSAMKQHDETA